MCEVTIVNFHSFRHLYIFLLKGHLTAIVLIKTFLQKSNKIFDLIVILVITQLKEQGCIY